MKELRKDNFVSIQLKDKTLIEGVVLDYSHDRILILINDSFIEKAKKINELDTLFLTVNTHLGLKNMISSTISTIDCNNCIVVENNEAVPVEQKREFVRVLSNLSFKIILKNETFKADCINISAGGVAFLFDDFKLNNGDEIDILFDNRYFQKEIRCRAKIVKASLNNYSAKFIDLPPSDEDKIMKYVFSLIVKK